MVNWLFRNRRTGELTIMQAPNAPIILWLVATLINVIFDPGGRLGTARTVFAVGELIIWAGDEVIRGVNPFRRALGVVVLVVIAVGIATR